MDSNDLPLLKKKKNNKEMTVVKTACCCDMDGSNIWFKVILNCPSYCVLRHQLRHSRFLCLGGLIMDVAAALIRVASFFVLSEPLWWT